MPLTYTRVKLARCRMQGGREPLTPIAELVAYLGLLPLIAAPLAMAFLPSYTQRELAQHAALAYGATLLAAVGAVHWGFALAGRLSLGPRQLAATVLPAVLGAVSVLLGGQRGLALLVVSFGLFWHYEHRVMGEQLPEPYVRLRRNLTLSGCILLALTMILSDMVGLR